MNDLQNPGILPICKYYVLKGADLFSCRVVAAYKVLPLEFGDDGILSILNEELSEVTSDFSGLPLCLFHKLFFHSLSL